MSKGVLLVLTPWSSSQMLGLSFPVPSPRGGHCLSICIATYYSDDVPIVMFLQFRPDLCGFGLLSGQVQVVGCHYMADIPAEVRNGLTQLGCIGV